MRPIIYWQSFSKGNEKDHKQIFLNSPSRVLSFCYRFSFFLLFFSYFRTQYLMLLRVPIWLTWSRIILLQLFSSDSRQQHIFYLVYFIDSLLKCAVSCILILESSDPEKSIFNHMFTIELLSIFLHQHHWYIDAIPSVTGLRGFGGFFLFFLFFNIPQILAWDSEIITNLLAIL